MLDRRDNQYETELLLSMGKDVSAKREHTDNTSAASPSSDSIARPASTESATSGAQRTGRWTPDEKILFLYGLRRFGKGRWKKMSIYLPNRSLVQIKSHAQKVLKRLEAGENVFRRLEENYSLVDSLIVQAAKQRGTTPNNTGSGAKSASTAAKRKRASKKLSAQQEPSTYSHANSFASSLTHENANLDCDGGTGAVIAAAALCQLSSLGGWESSATASLQKTC